MIAFGALPCKCRNLNHPSAHLMFPCCPRELPRRGRFTSDDAEVSLWPQAEPAGDPRQVDGGQGRGHREHHHSHRDHKEGGGLRHGIFCWTASKHTSMTCSSSS